MSDQGTSLTVLEPDQISQIYQDVYPYYQALFASLSFSLCVILPNSLIVKEFNIEQVSDETTLIKLIEETLNENPQSIVDFHNGNDRALGFLVGQVMKKSRGQANPQMTNELLIKALNEKA